MWNWKQRLQFFGFLSFIGMLLRRVVKGHWSIYSDLIGTSTSEATTETELTGSPYSPLTSGRLKKVIVQTSGSDAASLWEGGYVVLKSVSFGGVDLYIPFTGPGLHTAPAFPTPNVELECDLAVKTGVTIKAFLKHQTADTPVTFEAQVIGVFQG